MGCAVAVGEDLVEEIAHGRIFAARMKSHSRRSKEDVFKAGGITAALHEKRGIPSRIGLPRPLAGAAARALP
jgi:hypothetical protein